MFCFFFKSLFNSIQRQDQGNVCAFCALLVLLYKATPQKHLSLWRSVIFSRPSVVSCYHVPCLSMFRLLSRLFSVLTTTLPDLEVKDLNKRMSGQSFEVILKPSDSSRETGLPLPVPSAPKRELSLDDLQKRLEAAEERRKVAKFKTPSNNYKVLKLE